MKSSSQKMGIPMMQKHEYLGMPLIRPEYGGTEYFRQHNDSIEHSSTSPQKMNISIINDEAKFVRRKANMSQGERYSPDSSKLRDSTLNQLRFLAINSLKHGHKTVIRKNN